MHRLPFEDRIAELTTTFVDEFADDDRREDVDIRDLTGMLELISVENTSSLALGGDPIFSIIATGPTTVHAVSAAGRFSRPSIRFSSRSSITHWNDDS